MKKRLLLLLILLSAGILHAQDLPVKGVVTNVDDKTGIPGVSIVEKGTLNGTTTDVDGKFQLTVHQNAILEFRYIGMKTKEVSVTSGKDLYVELSPDQIAVNEVVVTAMGIRKEKKSLGYAVQRVGAVELQDSKQNNLVNALQGKVAGVTVTNSGGAPGASSVIMIRGGNSLSGDNQPLFVVDGIPIDNSTENNPAIASSNRALDINPEDIASISILKGPAAAALYGIKAANGAVVITTKSGKAGKAQISYSGSASVDQVMSTPDIQMVYGQGTQMDDGSTNTSTTYSWAKDPLSASTPRYNNLKDFYKTAITQNHNLTYSAGTDKTSMYMSIGRLDQSGVIDHTNYDRTSVRLKADSKLKKNLDVGGSFNYVNSESDRTRQGSSNSGNFRSILSYPINIDMKDYLNTDGTQKFIPGVDDAPIDNPYWSGINNPINNRVDRFIGIGNVSYNPFDFMNITYRLGSDIFFEKNKSIYASGSATYNNGYISEYEAFNQITTSTLLLNFNKSIKDNNLALTVGNNVESSYYRKTYWTGQNFIEADFPGIDNTESSDRTVGQSTHRKRIVSLFGEFKYDWKSLVFLNATGRVDKSSTLPKNNNVFFYPSFGIAVLPYDILQTTGNDFLSPLGISYWKIRATWAQVGKDAPPHVLITPMASETNSYTIDPGGFIHATYPTGNPGLKPEFTTSMEVGTDLRFFKNRLGVDFTYYNSKSEDQILFVRMPPSTSTYGGYLNAGTVKNSGIELVLNAKPVVAQNFSWNLDLNFSKMKSWVTALPGTIEQVEESDSWAFNSIAEGAAFLDGPLFGIYGKTYLKDDNGNLLLDENGMVQVDPVQHRIGDRAPKWTLGLTNTLHYKNITLSFLWDVSYGNDVLNGTEAALAYYGLSPVTLNRNTQTTFKGLIPTGEVDANGDIIYTQNTKAVTLDQAYYQDRYAAVGENFVEDGSWLRLRYVTLTYNLPDSWFKNKVTNAQIYFTGRNLLLFTGYSGVDPEVNTIGAAVKGTGSIGIDNLGTPSTKGFDIGVRLSF